MMENVKFRPYWQYVAVMDAHTRPAHAAMNGLTFRYDDPFWEHFYPPNGFNCRCTVRALSKANLKDRGGVVSESGAYLREVWDVDRNSGLTAPVAVFKLPSMPAAGRTDMGWNYSPGRAAWQPDLDAYAFDLAQQYVAGSTTGPDFARFVAAAGEIKGEFPVAVLNPADKASLGAKSQVVLLSDATLAKQVKHPVGMAEYQQVQSALDSGEVYRQGDLRLVYFRQGDAWLRVTVKVTQDGEKLYLVSVFAAREREVLRAQGTLEKLR
jgi:hypothetical protein